MHAIARAFVTIVIWIFCVGVALTSIIVSDGNFGFGAVMITLLPMVLALLGTVVIWENWDTSSTATEEKAKRSAMQNDPKFEMLMSMMDEDERRAFKAKLQREVLANMRLSDEGELPEGLETLLEETAYLHKP